MAASGSIKLRVVLFKLNFLSVNGYILDLTYDPLSWLVEEQMQCFQGPLAIPV